MKNSYRFLVLTTALLALSLAACSSWPSQMFTLAEKAKSEAIAVQADQFAADLWISAETAWQEGNARAQAKKYGEADKFFLKAKSDYVRARDSAKSKRDELIRQVNANVVTIGIRLKSDLVDNAAAKNLPAGRKKDFDAAVKDISDTGDIIKKQLSNGQVVEAKLLTDKALRRIWDVQQEYLKK